MRVMEFLSLKLTRELVFLSANHMSKQNIIVVSNRLPITVSKKGGKLTYTPSSGGLATAVSSIASARDIVWVGWPGIASDELTPSERRNITKRLQEYSCSPVFLTKKQIEDFYEGYSNETLWPMFHYFQSVAQINEKQWHAYKHVNGLFAKATLKHTNDKSTIWIHDYHLLLLPKIIRVNRPSASIGFFLHIPFPSFELFRLLPHRRELLEGMLGADLVGFHIYDYVRHFTSSVLRTLGHNSEHGVIIYNDRVVKADAFPIGIDYKKFRAAVSAPSVKRELELLQKHYEGKKIILSVDRLDYTKGIITRLEAFEQFLKLNPQYRNKVTLVVIAVPSRVKVDAYRDLREQVEQTISRINGTYASSDWIPIAYQFQNLPFDKLVALYAHADVALVTPLRDGMNLVAKEYVASQQGTTGVLVLSELAGAVDELPESLVVNPNDTVSIVSAIQRALALPARQKKSRIATMQRRISSYDAESWASDFLEQLSHSKEQQSVRVSKILTPASKRAIAGQYKKAQRRLLVFDYDGTLKEFVSSPKISDAAPSKAVLKLIRSMAARFGTDLYIISGRTKDALEKWFGELPVHLIAEHGYWTRKSGVWLSHGFDASDYQQLVMPLLKKYTERTPGAVIESKSSSIVWHYRNVPPELAYVRRQNLQHDLAELLADTEVGVHKGNKIIEIKPHAISKGQIVERLLRKKTAYDFVLCCGDDYTDEDMFEMLASKPFAHTVKIGLGETKAKHQVQSVKEMLSLLKSFEA